MSKVNTRAAVITCAVLAGSGGSAAGQDLGRWVDVQAFNVAARYRFVQDDQNVRTSHDVQDSSGFKARVKADRAGRIALNVGVFTGGSFASSWNSTGIGAAELSQPMNVKQLSLSVSPFKGTEAQVGSLYLVRGESTEITHYDNDGFLTGERLTVKRPGQFFFDEITVTSGYLGDLKTTNAFERADRLNDFNFRQMLVGKKVGARVAMSAEWTDAVDQETWRGAVAVKVPRFVDAVRVEYYARPDADARGGAVSIERTLPRRIAVAGGYAHMDAQVGSLTGDKFGRGERVFGSVTVPVVNALSANVFYAHALSNAFAVANDQRVDVVVSYNVLAAFQKRGAK
jgi:hypothetical protein